MGWCTAQYKLLLFCVKTIVKESHNFELAHASEEEERRRKEGKHFGHLVTFRFGTFVMHHKACCWL